MKKETARNLFETVTIVIAATLAMLIVAFLIDGIYKECSAKDLTPKTDKTYKTGTLLFKVFGTSMFKCEDGKRFIIIATPVNGTPYIEEGKYGAPKLSGLYKAEIKDHIDGFSSFRYIHIPSLNVDILMDIIDIR